MRESLAAVAVIRQRAGDQTLYLAQWNEGWQRYSLVGGHKHDDESFRECLIREVHEELGLTEGAHYRLSDKPPAHLQFEAWSERASEQTAYTFEVFELTLADVESESLRVINALPTNRWLTRDEVESGTTADGKSISATVSRLLREVLQASHVSAQSQSETKL